MKELDQIALNKIAKTDHEIHELIKKRYSPRIFSDKKLTQKDMNQLFEATRWSASSNNWQPWRFIYAYKSSDTYKQIN